jgi:hypothetical protein
MVYMMQAPFAYEYDDALAMVEGSYTITFVDGEIYISLNTPISWLTDPARNFPIVVDPNIYVTISWDAVGYIYHYYYKSGTYVNDRYYYYGPAYTYTYLGFYGYSYSYYQYSYTRRAWFKWNTSAIPDSYTIKQIDFHGKDWRNSYSAFTVNVREAPLKPTDYSSSSSQANLIKLFNSMASGRIYNSSVSFANGYGKDVDIAALGGTANQDMQDNLTKNEFFLAMHKVIESFLSTGYGYFYMNKAQNAQLYVTYDPCPTAPIPDTGGPYVIPEGTNGVTLDASGTFACGSSILYYWDTNEDNVYDIVSTQPKVFWNKNFDDDWSTKLTLMVKDLSLSLSSTATTTFTVENVNPEIITPATPISGDEGSTITFPKIEFTDPGKDTWTYSYDFDGDNEADKTGSTIDIGGKHFVPSVSWYFCDDVAWVNLTVEDEDGGFSDSVGEDKVEVTYDGDIHTYKRVADPSRDYTYRYMSYSSSSYPYMYVQKTSYMTSYDYEYRGLMKFDTSSLPSTFEPTNVTLKTYLSYVSAPGLLGVNDLSSDPYTSAYSTTWADADDVNILESGDAIDITTSDSASDITMFLDPQDFIDEVDDHSSWYGVAFDAYDKEDDDIYMYFYGGTYTSLTVSDGTNSYTLRDYTNSWNNRNGMHGYMYFRSMPARDEMWRDDTNSYMYLRQNYVDYYNGVYNSKDYIKFGSPHVDQNKIIGADMSIYVQYFYATSGFPQMKVGINDLDYDPETASDSALWNDIDSSNVYDDTAWEPDDTNTRFLLPLDDQDYLDKLAAHGDWYGIGMKFITTNVNYMYMASSEYYTQGYQPELLVAHRIPFKLPLSIANLDPVMDTSEMVVTPTTVKEGDEVSVSGITYTDGGKCDTHRFRVIVDLGPTRDPIIAKDWTEAKDGKIDFKFNAPDDDPEDLDLDISKDDVKITIELQDDDYTPDFHYDTITLELTHYEYYMFQPYKDWGVYQQLKPWDEMTATWKNTPRSQAKSTPEDTVSAHGSHSYYYPYSNHWDKWDITTLAKKWIDGSEDNFGLRVAPVTTAKDSMELYSSDYYTGTLRPILRFTPLEITESEIVLQPGPAEGKDVNVRAGYYENQNFGTYSYLVYSYDYRYTDTWGYYKESEGLIEFDLSNAPPETDEAGIDTATFDLTISNVAPVLDDSAHKLRSMDGEDLTSVKEGQDFMLTNIVFDDPAAGHETETFEYRIDWGNGTTTPWAEAKAVTPGGHQVVPSAYEFTDAPSYTNSYFGYYYYTAKRYMQLLDADEMGGNAKVITEVQWKPTYYAYYLQYEWTAHFGDLKIYMSHKSDELSGNSYSDNYGFDRTLVFSGALDWHHPADSEDWMGIELDTAFVYDGTSNLVLDISYTDYSVTSTYTYSACMFQYEYSSSAGQMIYSYDATSDTGYGPYTNTYVYKFIFDDTFDEPYGIIPPISHMYPDDHPSTGTASDDMEISFELRDDDGGESSGSIGITVENVPPSLKQGKILVDGKKPAANILIVKDNYVSSYNIEGLYSSVLASFGKTADVIISNDATKFNAANMANYDLVIYLMNYRLYYYYYTWSKYDYMSEAEALVIKDYLENHSGNLWFVDQYTYSYTYGYPTPPAPPSWPDWFFPMFGVDLDTDYQQYIYPSQTIKGTGNWWDTTDTFTVTEPTNTYFSYDYYMTLYGLSGGTSELKHSSYSPQTAAHTMVHKENSAWGSKALISGFDLNQISDADEQEELMKKVLAYFDIPEYYQITIDEGQSIELVNWDIEDPAEDEPTEPIHFEIDWGDSETGPLTNATGQDGINMQAAVTGDLIIHPNAATTPNSGGNTIPWGPGFGVKRYMQYYGKSQFGGKSGDINGWGFRFYQSYTWSITYYNLKVYLSHKTTSGLSSTFANNYGTDRTLVINQASFTWTKSVTGQPFTMMMFDNNFAYNGKDNIVMEVSYTSGTPNSNYYFNTYSTSDLARLYAYSPTATTGSVSSNYGMVTQFSFEKQAPPASPQPWQSYLHRYKDDPAVGNEYVGTVHAYDDDEGEGTMEFHIKVNNIQPTIEPQFVVPQIIGSESGSPSVLLPQVPFDDPATQYDLSDPNEVWTYWWDLDNDGTMNNAPDVIGTVPQSAITEANNASSGKTPAVKAVVNDDYLRKPIAVYIFDDDMVLSPNTKADTESGTITVNNVAPTASIEAFVPMEVRVRMTGTQENDLRVVVKQTNPSDANDVLTDEMTIERMPGQPKENPFSDGTPSAPLFVKVQLGRTLELAVTFDATADANDVSTNSGPNGGDPVWLYVDFPEEDDYNPADDTQSSSQGHHWAKEIKFNVNQDGSIATDTTEITSLLKDKRGTLIGISQDDASDDAQFNWMVLSGSSPLPYTRITYFNDDSAPVVNGAFKDTYPSPWDGTAPCTYMDIHHFVTGDSFSVALYTIDDDGGRSNTATLVV